MLVSIIIACHRIDPHLPEALESLLRQTYKNIEIIFIANGKNHHEVSEYALKIGKSDSRLFIYETKIGQLSHALNIGIDKCQGDIIARMDSDDISEPNRIEKQLSFLIKEDLDILGCSCQLIDSNGLNIGERITTQTKKITSSYLIKCPLIHPSVMMKKKSILELRGYNAGFNSEDYDLWIRAIRSGLKIGNLNEKLIKYRVHENSTQGSRLAYAEVCGYVLRELLLKPSFKNSFSLMINIIKYYRNEVKKNLKR